MSYLENYAYDDEDDDDAYEGEYEGDDNCIKIIRYFLLLMSERVIQTSCALHNYIKIVKKNIITFF